LPLSLADLSDIRDYGYSNWGADQADAYVLAIDELGLGHVVAQLVLLRLCAVCFPAAYLAVGSSLRTLVGLLGRRFLHFFPLVFGDMAGQALHHHGHHFGIDLMA
jgi:hypothetical protein